MPKSRNCDSCFIPVKLPHHVGPVPVCKKCYDELKFLGTPASEQELRDIVRNPTKWYEEQVKVNSLDWKYRYFVLFTLPLDKPASEGGTVLPTIDIEKWFKFLQWEMGRPHIKKFYICFEHMDSNAHAHALIYTDKRIDTRKYYTKYNDTYGHAMVKIVNKDNGIGPYMEKETEKFTTVEDMKLP